MNLSVGYQAGAPVPGLHRPGGLTVRASRPQGPARGVLVVHPGAELYGADRVLLESATALATRFDVTVALPGPGPLVAELEARGVRVVQCRMPVLRNAALRPRGALRLLADAVLGALPALRLIRRYGPAGVYVNTLTLPSWPLLARLAGRRSLCHVHEAEASAPRLLRRGMALVPALADRVVANSRFTLDVLPRSPRGCGDGAPSSTTRSRRRPRCARARAGSTARSRLLVRRPALPAQGAAGGRRRAAGTASPRRRRPAGPASARCSRATSGSRPSSAPPSPAAGLDDRVRLPRLPRRRLAAPRRRRRRAGAVGRGGVLRQHRRRGGARRPAAGRQRPQRAPGGGSRVRLGARPLPPGEVDASGPTPSSGSSATGTPSGGAAQADADEARRGTLRSATGTSWCAEMSALRAPAADRCRSTPARTR